MTLSNLGKLEQKDFDKLIKAFDPLENFETYYKCPLSDEFVELEMIRSRVYETKPEILKIPILNIDYHLKEFRKAVGARNVEYDAGVFQASRPRKIPTSISISGMPLLLGSVWVTDSGSEYEIFPTVQGWTVRNNEGEVPYLGLIGLRSILGLQNQ